MINARAVVEKNIKSVVASINNFKFINNNNSNLKYE